MLALAVMSQPWTWVFAVVVVVVLLLAAVGVSVTVGRRDPKRTLNLVAIGLLVWAIFYFWTAVAHAPKG